MKPSERRLIAFVGWAHALIHIVELTYPALLTRIEDDFGIGAVVSGALATVFGWMFGSGALPAGVLTDRLGSRRVLVYSFAGVSVLSVLVALSPNEWFLAAGLGGLGLMAGLYHPAGTTLLVRGISQRGLALGLHGVAGNTGQALAPAIAVGLAVVIDWRAAFILLAVLAGLLALLLSRIQLAPESEPVHQIPDASTAAMHSPRRGHSLMVPLLIVYVAFILSGITYRGAITFLPKHLETFVNDELGAAFVTIALLTGAVGQLLGGTMSQRVRLERLAPLFGLLAIPALVLTALLSGTALVVLASTFVFFYFANQPVFNGLIADYSPEGAVGRSYGISFFSNFGLGSVGGVIAGAFVEHWDTRAAFLAMAGFLAGAIALALLLLILAERRARQRSTGASA